jgi:hypothetical protein
MYRLKNIAIQVSKEGFRAQLTNAEEEDEIPWTVGGSYSAVPNVANFYEVLRSRTTGLPIGVEIHLGAPKAYDAVLPNMYGFSKFQRFEKANDVWQFRFVTGDIDEGYIDWEQSLTQNPFLGENGVLLLIALWPLRDEEYRVFASLTELHTWK